MLFYLIIFILRIMCMSVSILLTSDKHFPNKGFDAISTNHHMSLSVVAKSNSKTIQLFCLFHKNINLTADPYTLNVLSC